MNSRIVTALAISAGLALVITGVFYQVALRDASAREAPMSEVVTAAKDLEVGSEIQPSDLRVEPWPSGKLPEGAHQDIELVISRVLVSHILAQEPVLVRRLAAPGAGVGLATKVPDGMRVMSIRVDDVLPRGSEPKRRPPRWASSSSSPSFSAFCHSYLSLRSVP